jgi:ferredoxin-NADP reductase
MLGPVFRRRRPAPGSGERRRDPILGLADAAITGLWAAAGAVRRIAPPAERDHTLELTVVDRRIVARDQNVVALTLAANGGGPLPAWHAGAHLDIRLPSGRLRQYSMCGEPGLRNSYRIAVRRISGGGGGSIEVHERLPVGSTVTTSGPRNAFPLALPGHGSPSTRLRFVAGGIGITPILPMLALADRLGVDFSMVYTGRSVESIPFVDEVRRFGDRITVRTDDADGLPGAAELLGDCPDGTTVYACGPAPMIAVIHNALAGRDRVELHVERFAAPPVVDGAQFTVTAASTGTTVSVGAEETLLAALQRAGADPSYSCRQGFCGTCRTRVLEGPVEHRDTLLTAPERAAGMMLTCVSRAPAGARLLLDL